MRATTADTAHVYGEPNDGASENEIHNVGGGGGGGGGAIKPQNGMSVMRF